MTNSAAGNVTLILASTATGISAYSGTIGNGAGTLNLLLSGPRLRRTSDRSRHLHRQRFRGGKRRPLSSLILANSGALLGATLINGNSMIFDQLVSAQRLHDQRSQRREHLDPLQQRNPGRKTAGRPAHQRKQPEYDLCRYDRRWHWQRAGGSFTKVGSGTLTLTGFGTCTGGTFIDGSELCPDSPVAIPGNITFGSSALQYDANDANGLSGSIFNSSGPIAIDANGQQVILGTTFDSSNIGRLTKLGAARCTSPSAMPTAGRRLFRRHAQRGRSRHNSLGQHHHVRRRHVAVFQHRRLLQFPLWHRQQQRPHRHRHQWQQRLVRQRVERLQLGRPREDRAGTLVLDANNVYGGTTTVAAEYCKWGPR